MNIWVLIAIAAVVLALLITPLREGLVWLIRNGTVPVFTTFKHVLHVIIRAHANVLRNFLPRARIFFELRRARTSHTGE